VHTLAITLGQVAGFIVFMLVVGRKLFPWILWQVARTGSRELFTLCVIAAAVGIAYASTKLFGVSFALGAFFAGMVLRESNWPPRRGSRCRCATRSRCCSSSRSACCSSRYPHRQPLQVLAVCAIIIFGKSVAAFLLVLALRYPPKTALMVSASLAQIGEFSFILAALGLSLGLMPQEGQSLIWPAPSSPSP
jgi:CPA2 family monovalent cation:H+ antiporter-2